MARSHCWALRGTELIEPRPMNWGDNLTMIGALRKKGWITMSTLDGAMNRDRFARWVRHRLMPRLSRGDVVVLDNAQAHHDPRVRPMLRNRGIGLEYLPPYSPDLNPIEPGWALVKKHIKRHAPRTRDNLVRIAHAGRRRVLPNHCAGWFAHAGYP
jgi:transposase